MKLNFKNSQNNTQLFRHRNNNLELTAYNDKYKNKENKNINTHRPAQDISFGGSAVSASKKFIQNKALNKTLKVTEKHYAKVKAVQALILAGMLKPLCVLNMPGSEDKDKQIVATKNFLNAFVGFGIGYTLDGVFVKKIVEKMDNNLDLMQINKKDGKNIVEVVSEEHQNVIKQAKNLLKSRKTEITPESIASTSKEIVSKAKEHVKYFNRNPEFIKKLLSNYQDENCKVPLKDVFHTFWESSTGWISAIAKAKISSLLLPTTLALFFANKGAKKAKENSKKQNTQQNNLLTNSKVFQKEQEIFKPFLKPQEQLSFKGNVGSFFDKSLSLAIDKTVKGAEFLATSKLGETAVSTLSKLPKKINNPVSRMNDLESFIITGYWVNNTNKSKKIEESQKLGLNVHSVLVTLVSSIAAYAVDTLLDKPINNIINEYKNHIEEAIESSNGKTNQKELIEKACEQLYKSENITKRIFSETGELLKEKELANAIDSLANNYGKILKKFKSLTIFTMVVRFLVPVLMVPVSGNMKRKINSIINQRQEQKASKS